jgi:hypothetical protein
MPFVKGQTDNTMATWKRTNNDLQNTTQKTKVVQHEPHIKPRMNSDAVEGYAVLVPLVTSVMLLYYQPGDL